MPTTKPGARRPPTGGCWTRSAGALLTGSGGTGVGPGAVAQEHRQKMADTAASSRPRPRPKAGLTGGPAYERVAMPCAVPCGGFASSGEVTRVASLLDESVRTVKGELAGLVPAALTAFTVYS